MNLKILKDSQDKKHACNVSTISLNQDESKLFSGSDDGILKIWSADLQLLSEINASDKGAIVCLAVASDTLYSLTSDQTITAWDLNTLKPSKQLITTLNAPLKLYYQSEKKLLWAGDSTGSVAKFADNRETGRYELMEEIWDLLVVEHEDKPLVYTARDRDVAVHQIGSGRQAITKATIPGRSPLTVINDKLLFLSREGKSIRIHENDVSKRFPPVNEISASELILNALSCKFEGNLLVGGYDNKITSWDISSGQSNGSVDVNATVNAIIAGSKGAYTALSDGRVLLVA